MRKNIIILIVLAVIILGGAFYWFELRPDQIRRYCLEGINYFEYAEELKSKNAPIKDYSSGMELYKYCLQEHGLEK